MKETYPMVLPSPKSNTGCRYEQYDPETLEPNNNSTYVRLIETGWNEETFKGQSVLDIGCNAGALSLFAHSLGANSVHSVDVTTAFVEFFSAVVDHHKLPILVEKKAFHELTPEKNTADVVLCMEVLHWIVHQGGKLPDAIGHLAAITRKTLYVETPWDIKEPSIAQRDGYPTEDYNIELIIRALSRHFATVRIERFMTYFGEMADTKRVMIMATDKRASTLPLRHFIDANATGISLSRGMNESSIVTTTAGPKVLKTLPQNSCFVKMDSAAVDRLCDFLVKTSKDTPLVLPEKMGTHYRSSEEDGKTYMIYPFVGDMKNYFPKFTAPKYARNPMGVAVDLFSHFASVGADVLDPLKSTFGRLSVINPADLEGNLPEVLTKEMLSDVTAEMTDYDAGLEDGLLHFDMQLGNMIVALGGRDRLVDIDLMRAGPRYADIFSCALHTGTTEYALRDALNKAQSITRARAPTKFDVAFAINSGLLWLIARLKQTLPLSEKAKARFEDGLKIQYKVMQEL